MKTTDVIETDVNDQYQIHIEAKTKLLDIDLKELWRYRDLVFLFTKRSFVVKYKQTILGPAWLILNPFLTSVIFTLVFGKIAGLSSDGVPEILFYLGSNAVWSFFANCLTQTAGTFTSNSSIFGKVYFPRLTMPISTVISSMINFGIQFLMFGVFWLYFIVTNAIQPNYAFIPLYLLVLIQLGALGLGFGIIISSLTTKYRDLAILVGFGVSLWMYGTPVIYPISKITNKALLFIAHINPATQALETFRYIFLGNGEVSVFWWVITIISTAIILCIGVLLFNKVEKTFMDTI